VTTTLNGMRAVAVALLLALVAAGCGGDRAFTGLRLMVPNTPGSGYDLTAQGALLLVDAEQVEAAVDALQRRMAALDGAGQGHVRVASLVTVGQRIISSGFIERFHDLHPGITVEMLMGQRVADLARGEADVAIRMVMPRQPGLVQRHLLTVRSHVYAAHSYIQKYGKPKSIDELDQHRLIIFGEDARAPVQDVNWLLREGNPDQAARLVVLRVNNTYGIFRAVESGLGIASLPDYLARESTKIDMVLPELNVRTTDVYFTYPEELRHSKRIAVFRDFLLRKVAETRF